jgi:hypothetical protein
MQQLRLPEYLNDKQTTHFTIAAIDDRIFLRMYRHVDAL